MRSVLIAILLVFAAPAPAEPPFPDAASGAPAAVLDEIAVTGSHIRAVDLETQHPILVIDRVEIERSGLTSLSDVVDLIVSNGPTANRNVNNGSNGEQLANLRSFGFNRTLVLLNGQRFVSDIQGAVDLSGIPLALVDRVEVLLDGASAIYGSDAITGVINIITRRNYEGGELAAYYGENSHDDGARDAFALTFGHKAESWSAAGGVEYTHDEPIFAGDRAISSVPYFGLPPGATGSTATPYAWLIPDSVANDCGFNGGNLGRCSLRLIDGRPGTSPDDFRRVDTTRDRFNFAPQNYLQTPQQRRAAFAQARWELSSKLAVSLEALFNQRESTQQLGPSNLQFNVLDAPSSDAFPIAADNLYNPFGEPVDFGRRRLVEAGSRYFHQTDDTRRLHLGVDGAFALWGRDFLWSADAIQTRSDTAESTGPYADNRKLALALGPSFRDAAGTAHCGTPQAPVDGCVPLDFFGPPGSITQPMLDYIDLFESNRSRDTTRNYGVHVSANDLVALPAGGVGFGAGLEYRHEAGAQLLDALDASGYANGNGETRHRRAVPTRCARPTSSSTFRSWPNGRSRAASTCRSARATRTTRTSAARPTRSSACAGARPRTCSSARTTRRGSGHRRCSSSMAAPSSSATCSSTIRATPTTARAPRCGRAAPLWACLPTSTRISRPATRRGPEIRSSSRRHRARAAPGSSGIPAGCRDSAPASTGTTCNCARRSSIPATARSSTTATTATAIATAR